MSEHAHTHTNADIHTYTYAHAHTHTHTQWIVIIFGESSVNTFLFHLFNRKCLLSIWRVVRRLVEYPNPKSGPAFLKIYKASYKNECFARSNCYLCKDNEYEILSPTSIRIIVDVIIANHALHNRCVYHWPFVHLVFFWIYLSIYRKTNFWLQMDRKRFCWCIFVDDVNKAIPLDLKYNGIFSRRFEPYS